MSGPDLRAVTPVGLVLDKFEISGTRIAMTARSATPEGCCPDCGGRSARLHSRYARKLLDLPSHGRPVELRVAVRRFRCPDRACPRRTFAERLNGRIAPRWARRTARLEDLVHRLWIVLGGRPAASLARRLMLPVSKAPCFASCGDAWPPQSLARALSASINGLGGVANATA